MREFVGNLRRTLDEARERVAAHLLERAKAIYEDLPGWSEKVDHLRTWDDLPAKARSYLKRVEELAGVPVIGVSVGADRGETILRQNPFKR